MRARCSNLPGAEAPSSLVVAPSALRSSGAGASVHERRLAGAGAAHHHDRLVARSAFLRWMGLALVGLTAFKFVFSDLAGADPFWRVSLTAIVAGAAMLASRGYQREAGRGRSVGKLSRVRTTATAGSPLRVSSCRRRGRPPAAGSASLSKGPVARSVTVISRLPPRLAEDLPHRLFAVALQLVHGVERPDAVARPARADRDEEHERERGHDHDRGDGARPVVR